MAGRDLVARCRALLHGSAREPLLHFLVIGAALVVLGALAGSSPASGRGDRQIHVTPAKLQQLTETWQMQTGRVPTSEETRDLVEEYVREEVFYREAMRMGLDENDTIVRRRLAQKMEFVARGVGAADELSEAELRAFFAGNRERYAEPAKVTFGHLYFRQSGREPGEAAAAASAMLARLQTQGLSEAEARALGDPFMLQYEYVLQTLDQIRGVFGVSFAECVFDLQPGVWSGPITSVYGAHLVFVKRIVPSKMPDLEDVRERVAFDYNDDRMRADVEDYYQSVRQRYQIDVDPALVSQ